MLAWYQRLHPWNRILLTALAAVVAARAVSGTFTADRMILTFLFAAVMWGCGWPFITTWSLIRDHFGRKVAYENGHHRAIMRRKGP